MKMVQNNGSFFGKGSLGITSIAAYTFLSFKNLYKSSKLITDALLIINITEESLNKFKFFNTRKDYWMKTNDQIAFF